MIKEAYCSFEVAKLLKEKGFNEKCTRWYVANEPQEGIVEKGFGENQFYINAPTHQTAMAWLRQEKNIIVNVWYNGVDWDAEYYNNEDENFYLITDSSCNSYEESVEVALKYVIENLI